MAISFKTHDAGCTPMSPCLTCRAAAFLRKNLESVALIEFLTLIGNEQSEVAVPLDADLATLDFSKRIKRTFSKQNINTVDELLQLSERELLRIPAFGRVSVDQVVRILAIHGMKLRGDSVQKD